MNIESNGKVYDLKFNLKRISIIENAIKKPLMSVLANGFISINDLKVIVAYGMIEVGADAFINPKKGIDIIETLLEESGSYQKLTEMLAEALERDCPFFFPAG